MTTVTTTITATETATEIAGAKPAFDLDAFASAKPYFLLSDPPKGREDQAAAIIEAHTDFATRAEYLAWRAAWRSAYSTLSAEIRSLKAQRKESHPQHDPSAWRTAKGKGALAEQMLALRAASKAKAGRQRADALGLKTA